MLQSRQSRAWKPWQVRQSLHSLASPCLTLCLGVVQQYLHGLVHFHAGILLTRTATFVNECFKQLLLHGALKHISIVDRLRPVTRSASVYSPC